MAFFEVFTSFADLQGSWRAVTAGRVVSLLEEGRLVVGRWRRKGWGPK